MSENPAGTPAVVAVEMDRHVVASKGLIPRRIWPVFAALLLALFFAICTQVLLAVGATFWLMSKGTSLDQLAEAIQPFMMTPLMFLLLIATGPSMFGVSALIAARCSSIPWRERLMLVPAKVSVGVQVCAILGSLAPAAVGIALAEGLVYVWPSVPVDSSILLFFEQVTILWSIPFVILIGLVPGFAEEMLFRGYMQSRLIQRFGAPTGIIIASIFFGLAHVMPATILMATFIGFYLGFVAWKSGSIWPTIGAHIFINSSINFFRMAVKFGEIPETTQWVIVVIALSISAICFVFAMTKLIRLR